MWGKRRLEPLPFLSGCNPVPFILRVWLWHMRSRIVCDKPKLRTAGHVKHVRQGHVIMVDGLD